MQRCDLRKSFESKNQNFGEPLRRVNQSQACSGSEVASGGTAQQVIQLGPAVLTQIFI